MSMELMVKAMKTKVGNPLRKLVLIKLADNANRIGDTTPLTLAGGTLTFSNNAGAVNYAESIGGLTLGATTLSTINTSQAATGQTATLTFDALARSAGAVLNVTGTGLGTDARNRVVFTTAPTVTNGLAPAWITIGGAERSSSTRTAPPTRRTAATAARIATSTRDTARSRGWMRDSAPVSFAYLAPIPYGSQAWIVLW